MFFGAIKGVLKVISSKEDKKFVIDPVKSLITYYMSPILPAVYKLYKTEEFKTTPLPVSEDFYGSDGTENDIELLHEDTKDGTLFLMFHGFSDTARTCMPLAKHFHILGYSVIAPRIEGHGLMSYFDIPTENLKEKMIESAYQKYLKAANLPGVKNIIIVGFSMGGALTINLTRKIQMRKDAPKIVKKIFLLAPAIFHQPITYELMKHFGKLYECFPTLPFPRIYGDYLDPYYTETNYGYSCINGAITSGLNRLMIDAHAILPRINVETHLIVGERDGTLDENRWDEVYELIGSKEKSISVIEGGNHQLMANASIVLEDGEKVLKSIVEIEKRI